LRVAPLHFEVDGTLESQEPPLREWVVIVDVLSSFSECAAYALKAYALIQD
jgi:hypothetical protein